MRLSKSLLWIDCTGGLLAGAFVLAASPWLSELYKLPLSLLIVSGAANVVYGSFSFSLARRMTRPRALLLLLAGANMAWAVACVVAAGVLATQASVFGLAHLLLEGVYVGGLGFVEWKHVDELLTQDVS